MIKFIASDLDGTLLVNGNRNISDSMISVIRELIKRGVIFSAASGRQHSSIKALFEEVSDKIMYIAENGSLVIYKNKVIAKSPMDKKLALEIMEDIRDNTECAPLASGVKTAYVWSKNRKFFESIKEITNYTITVVDSFDEIEEDILKITACDMTGDIRNHAKYLTDKWKDKAAVAISGGIYLDFNDLQASKGHAIKQIQEQMNFDVEECMAFGDNYNDITMFDSVGFPCVMKTADDAVKEHAKYEIDSVDEMIKNVFKINI